MKLSFSTVGCPRWQWREILICAKELGYDGIELRGLGDDLYLPDIKLFEPSRIAKTKKELEDLKLELCILSSEIYLHDPNYDAEGSLLNYIKLSKELGVKNIRVLGDSWPQPGGDVDLSLVERRLRTGAAEAEKAGVTLLLESNGVLTDTKMLANLIENVSSPALGALWDIHHTVRYGNESITQSLENIGKYIGHVHVKDGIWENNEPVYKMTGYGTLPLMEAFNSLRSIGYKGYLSMEWVKRWNDGLEEPGVVFAHYIYQMKRYLKNGG